MLTQCNPFSFDVKWQVQREKSMKKGASAFFHSVAPVPMARAVVAAVTWWWWRRRRRRRRKLQIFFGYIQFTVNRLLPGYYKL